MNVLPHQTLVATSDTDQSPAVIQALQLTKRYRHITALDHVSLSVPEGTIYGFLGPNGAGKTTLIKILLGFIRPTTGSATIFGHNTWKNGVQARERLGYLVVPESLYSDMSGEGQLNYAADLSGREPVLRSRFLDALELPRTVLDRRLGTYSKGMRQKLALTATFQTDPDLLILDEPTDGLDPLIRRNFEELLRERHAAGRTIFMSSHDLAEVERVCERVAVIRDGKIVAEETVYEMTRRRLKSAEVVFHDAIPGAIHMLPNVRVLDQNGPRVRLTVEGDVNPLIQFLGNYQLVDFSLAPPSLEDIFMGFYDQKGSSPNGLHPSQPGEELVITEGRGS
jgi:ABC-2 type transport system ATP-binding protein